MATPTKREIEERGIDAVACELACDGLSASPADDTPGVDLWTRDSHGRRVPLQVMAASGTGFGIHIRYSRVAGIILVYAWNMDRSVPAEFYAMRWPECRAIATKLGWTQSGSWAKLQYYVQTKASGPAKSALRPHRMTRDAWRQLVG